MRIARRLNAGIAMEEHGSPNGTAESCAHGERFNRPFGTWTLRDLVPAFKRRAIVGLSLRDSDSSNRFESPKGIRLG